MQPSFENPAETTQPAQQQTQPLTQQTQVIAGQAVDQIRQQATSRLEAQKDNAAKSLTGMAQALRQTGQHLEEQDQRPAIHAMDMAAQQFERLVAYLENRDVSQLVGDAENLARRQPTLFLGGAFALGVLASRFLKSAAPDRDTVNDPSTSSPIPEAGQQDEDGEKTPEAVFEPPQKRERKADGTSI